MLRKVSISLGTDCLTLGERVIRSLRQMWLPGKAHGWKDTKGLPAATWHVVSAEPSPLPHPEDYSLRERMANLTRQHRELATMVSIVRYKVAEESGHVGTVRRQGSLSRKAVRKKPKGIKRKAEFFSNAPPAKREVADPKTSGVCADELLGAIEAVDSSWADSLDEVRSSVEAQVRFGAAVPGALPGAVPDVGVLPAAAPSASALRGAAPVERAGPVVDESRAVAGEPEAGTWPRHAARSAGDARLGGATWLEEAAAWTEADSWAEPPAGVGPGCAERPAAGA